MNNFKLYKRKLITYEIIAIVMFILFIALTIYFGYKFFTSEIDYDNPLYESYYEDDYTYEHTVYYNWYEVLMFLFFFLTSISIGMFFYHRRFRAFHFKVDDEDVSFTIKMPAFKKRINPIIVENIFVNDIWQQPVSIDNSYKITLKSGLLINLFAFYPLLFKLTFSDERPGIFLKAKQIS